MAALDKMSSRAPGGVDKEDIKLKAIKLNAELIELQNVLYAENKWKVLVILQGMDASGKDGVVKNVFRGVNPLGIRVKSFKAPSAEERSYNYLWRIYRELPHSGMIQVFNRSHYEDILVPGVHKLVKPEILDNRFRQINAFEQVLTDDNTIVFKYYLHISRREQMERLNERITMPQKKWKYDPSDINESKLWVKYMKLYAEIFKKTGKHCPWMIVPAGQNWYRDYIILHNMVNRLKAYRMKYPAIKTKK